MFDAINVPTGTRSLIINDAKVNYFFWVQNIYDGQPLRKACYVLTQIAKDHITLISYNAKFDKPNQWVVDVVGIKDGSELLAACDNDHEIKMSSDCPGFCACLPNPGLGGYSPVGATKSKPSLYAPITLKDANAKPKHPKLDCCGYCGNVLYNSYNATTGVLGQGCDAHGLNVPVVNMGAAKKRHP